MLEPGAVAAARCLSMAKVGGVGDLISRTADLMLPAPGSWTALAQPLTRMRGERSAGDCEASNPSEAEA